MNLICRYTSCLQFELINGANTNVYFRGNTPLMEASFNHNPTLVKLLLEHDANPNSDNGFAMCMVFLGMRDWLLVRQEQPASEIVNLLLSHGFKGLDFGQLRSNSGPRP